MNRKIRLGSLLVFLLAAIAPVTAWSHGNEFDDHWLAAACTQAPVRGRFVGEIRETEFGVAIRPRARTTLVLYCNVEADLFHNLIQIVAEDNSPNVEVTATLLQQDISAPGSAPTAIVSVTTTDQPGLQVADLFFDPAVELNELFYMYFIRIEVRRTSSDPVWVYSVSLRDVL